MKSLRLALAACVLAAPLGYSVPARAEPSAVAKERFDEAAKAFAERRYADAGEAYERAAAISPHPAPYVNAAEAWALDGNYVRAARACDQALKLPLGPALQKSIEERLARLERSVATLEVDGAASLAIRIDGGSEIGPPARIRLSPGKHLIAVLDPDKAAGRTEEVYLAPGDHRHLVLATARPGTPPAPLVSAPTTEPAAAPPSRRGPPLGTWIALGTAVVAGGGAVAFGFLTASAEDDFDAKPTNDAADTFERNRLVTNVLVGVTATALLAAGAFWLFAPRSSTAASSPTRVVAGAGGIRLAFD